MNVKDAFKSIHRLYIETAPLIYYVEENLTYLALMDTIVEYLEDKPIEAISSSIILTEVLNQPIRSGRFDLEQAYKNILLNNSTFRLMDVTPTIAENAAKLRAKYNLRTPDALHVATALQTNCNAFLTNDLGLKRVNEIVVLVLDDLELLSD